jgi:hypothetical protein
MEILLLAVLGCLLAVPAVPDTKLVLAYEEFSDFKEEAGLNLNAPLDPSAFTIGQEQKKP